MIRKPEQKDEPRLPRPRFSEAGRERPATGEVRQERQRIEPPRIPVPQIPRARPALSTARSPRSRFSEAGDGRPARRTGAPRSTAPVRRKWDTTHEISSEGNNDSDKLRFVPLGGLEEVGRNCMFFEYKNEIVIIDMGLQFPEEETPGIDYIIPNITYLEKNKQKIRALILTHGHYDHIGAVPHVMERLGNPPIYATSITQAIVLKRQEDHPNAPKLEMHTVKYGDRVKVGNYFEAEFFGVPHTIPETMGVCLRTPVGNIVHFADFRLDYDEHDKVFGLEHFERIAKEGIHTLLIDSTNAEEEGHSLSEKVVEKNLEEIFRRAKGRIIVATFASLLSRIAEIIKICEKIGRRVAVTGYSMKANIQIAQNLGYIKAKEGTMISAEDIHKYHDDKVLILSTGAQGESNAQLMKIINGEHRSIKLKPGDTVALSSSVIPGNERSVQVVKDNLARQGATVWHSRLIDIHSSGHAPKDDLKLIMKTMKPRYVVPVHGYYFMRAANAQTAGEVGISKEHAILMDNGQVAELAKDDFKIIKDTVPAFYVMVDGLGVGDVEEVVLRDRRALAQEGMIVVIITMDRDKGKLLKSPDIISRGFIYLKENQEILEEMRKRIRTLMERLPHNERIEGDYLKGLIRDQLGQYLYNKTRRRPMILPVVIEI